MKDILFLACLLPLTVIGFAIYMLLVGSFFPKKILKVRCAVEKSRDRGLKKHLYPGGRSVVYEPHPSIRQYVNRYVLFTHEGYKYLKCSLDDSVKKLSYSVVMFNNKNEVIDVIDVDEKMGSGSETESLLIHQDTSYISLLLNSVNGENIRRQSLLYCRYKDMGIYTAVVTVLSFLQLVFLFVALNIVDNLMIGSGVVAKVNALWLIIPALIIGAIAFGIVHHRVKAKGVRWSKR